MSTNGEQPQVESVDIPTLTIVVDPKTMLPTWRCTAAAIAFWRMQLLEVLYQLEEQRRIAAAGKLKAAVDEQAKIDQLFASIGKPR